MPANTKRRTTTKRNTSGPWGGTNYKYKGTTTKTKSYTGSRKTTTTATRGVTAATGYQTYATQFATKVDSWRTLYNQTRGTAKYNRPTPTTLNTFANWVNKGAILHTISPTKMARWAKTWNKKFNPTNLTSCKSFLYHKYGKTSIKAVNWAKNGYYMIATTPTYKGKPFTWPRY